MNIVIHVHLDIIVIIWPVFQLLSKFASLLWHRCADKLFQILTIIHSVQNSSTVLQIIEI